MNTFLTAMRQATQRLIDENPVSIVVRRQESIPDAAGGSTLMLSALTPFHGRIVPVGRRAASVRWDEAGKMHLFDWSLVAPWSADVEVGDTFLADKRSFRVLRVIQREYTGEVYSIHADLEEVS